MKNVVSAGCPCGAGLHYTNETTRRIVERLIADQGDEMTVVVPGLGRWAVSRRYVALHGLTAREIPVLAERYGFRQVGES